MANDKIRAIEQQIFELTGELNELRKQTPRAEVGDYLFETPEGKVNLIDLFAGKDTLLAIHNMGQGCRYCTVWADGFNPFLPHLESTMAVVLLSKDSPETQRRLANARQWRFRMASHGGGNYMLEQVASGETKNMPGAAVYERDGDKVYRKNDCYFGPGDLYCSLWSLLALAGKDDFTPQFSYWSRPQKLDDGGDNVVD